MQDSSCKVQARLVQICTNVQIERPACEPRPRLPEEFRHAALQEYRQQVAAAHIGSEHVGSLPDQGAGACKHRHGPQVQLQLRQGHGGVGRGGCVQETVRGDSVTVPASKLDYDV